MPALSPQRQVEIADRQEAVLILVREGKTYREIGRELGISHTQVGNDLHAALDEIVRPAATELKKLHVARAEWAFSIAAKLAMGQNPDRALRALDRCLAALERLSRLEGTDEPAKARIEVVPEDVVEAEIRRLEAKLGENDVIDV